MDLLSAIKSHSEPRIEQGRICINLKPTQNALTFLAKSQGLVDDRQTFRTPGSEYDGPDTNWRPQPDQDNARDRDGGNGVTVQYF
jgi:hypothetical protein